jgi:histidinol-phosphatase
MSDDLELAMSAAVAGARLALRYFVRIAEVGREWKPDGSLVTEADRAVEAEIIEVLLAARPDDAVLGEEGGQRGATGGRRWIIDPIDGTVGFAAGKDFWLVLVALEVDSEVTVAVAAVPVQRRVWWAVRGAGAYVADLADDLADDGPGPARRVRTGTRPTADVATSRLGVVPLPADERVVAGLVAVTDPLPWRVHPGLLVADGELDLAVQTRGKVWDYAVPSLIVTEAGGRFSGFDAGSAHPHTGPALYSGDAALHTAALTHLAAPT